MSLEICKREAIIREIFRRFGRFALDEHVSEHLKVDGWKKLPLETKKDLVNEYIRTDSLPTVKLYEEESDIHNIWWDDEEELFYNDNV
jgi:hypothetical protein